MSLFDIDSMESNSVENSFTIEMMNEGVRLQKLEVLNWGTFNKNIWSFDPCGKTSLLTGDSGSGKSTIVDALTTLLVQPRKITYNKAADASAKERNAKSYVLGYYGRKYSLEGKGKPETLRDTNTYSVILGTFKNEITKKIATIAIFYWFKEHDSNPQKIYVVAEQELSIKGEFTDFKGDASYLRSRLKKDGHQTFKDFKSYATRFRKLLGNVSEQALDLFQQTISMKKVDALNEFVRESMLEYDDPNSDISKLLKHYENLNVAYQTVVTAQNQISSLEPISNKGKRYNKLNEEKMQIAEARDNIHIWFAKRLEKIIYNERKSLENSRMKVENDLSGWQHKANRIADELLELNTAIAQNGGNEIERLRQDLKYRQNELGQISNELEKYNKLASNLQLKEVSNFEEFSLNSQKLPEFLETNRLLHKKQQESLAKANINLLETEKELKEIAVELKSLQKRDSNIPSKLVKLRSQMCEELGLDEQKLPFAGELLEVKSSESKWEGALERLCHNFAISILVDGNNYSQVAKWVNDNKLGTKLVYFNTGKNIRNFEFGDVSVDAAYKKLLIKPNSGFTKWLEGQISYLYQHICCETIEEFKSASKAITVTGQIKVGERHEKDDRRKLQDRSRFVLGFNNKKKMKLLSEKTIELKKTVTKYEKKIKQNTIKLDAITKVSFDISNLQAYKDYTVIDTQSKIDVIKITEEKIRALEGSNSKLETLKKQFVELKKEEKIVKSNLAQIQNKQGQINFEISKVEEIEKENNEKLAFFSDSMETSFEYLKAKVKSCLGDSKLNISNAQSHEQKFSKELAKKYDGIQLKLSKLQIDIEKTMNRFRNDYPSESIDLSENILAISDYNRIYDELVYHNLPRYQQQFKEELQGKIIQHISLFNAKLLQNQKKIQKRINEINKSLYDIDYNIGRYIEIKCENSPEQEIRLFKQQLLAVTSGMYSEYTDDELAKQKFTEIQNIIERLKGRADSFDSDKRWRKKVTDVRNWFVFSASERWRETSEEYEHYSDSDGKSGGQKEKLAYTILAASLAYNYRIRDPKQKQEAFRLVVIDEAFLKSSDESAKFGLSLFEKMNFQLLVVTPLLKISTIEPFIEHVGYVSHSDKNHTSQLENIDKETFKRKLLK